MSYIDPLSATMGVVTEALGLSCRAVRHYEERGLISPQRDRRNRRVFDAQERQKLELIARLRLAGLGLADIREILALYSDAATDAWRHRARERLSDRCRKLQAEASSVASVLSWLNPAPPTQRRFGVL